MAANLLRLVSIGVEMALATVLLASPGLLLHSFNKIMSTDRGYAALNPAVPCATSSRGSE